MHDHVQPVVHVRATRSGARVGARYENQLNLAGVLWQFLNERQVCSRKDKGEEALSVHLRGAQLWQMGTV